MRDTQKPERISEILFPTKPYEYKLKKPKLRKKQPETMLFETDDAIKMRTTKFFAHSKASPILAAKKNSILKKNFKKKLAENFCIKNKPQVPLDVIDWEKDICYDEVPNTSFDIRNNELVNNIFEAEDWENQIIIEEEDISKFKPYATLLINDPNLIFEPFEEKKKMKKKAKEINIDKPLKSKFNISNDKYYDFEVVSKFNLGTHGVQHSVPALKLFTEFYKTAFTKEELRNFHRPSCNLPVGSFSFAPLKQSESRHSNLIKKVSEFDLCEDTNFQLVEYSEEYPPLIQNVGMISLIVNYHRKRNDDGENSREDFFLPTVNLNQEDESPFFNYGDVKIGEDILAISNNLFKAPLFRHKSNDFLCIFKNNEFYIRKIENILLAGQTYPLDVVYSPNSRKYNIFCKNRLKNIIYRYFNDKDNTLGIKTSIVEEIFPFFSEGSKKKWMKEFCDQLKKGKENYWVLKSTEPLLNEEELRKLVTPENVCQYESMLAAERRLLDSGISVANEEDEEVKMAPWNLTRNFISVCNGKGLLELEGKADPTGINEGFSFLKVKFKKGNETENRKIFMDLQAQYKNIIQKIWNKQLESLTSTKEIFLEKKEVDEKKKEVKTIDRTKPYIVIKRIYYENNERVEEEEEVFDKRVIDLYLQSRKNSRDDKRALKCGSCGQLGHMKTNKVCPNYSEKKVTKKSKENLRRRAKSFLIEKQLKLINQFFNMQYSSAFHRPVNVKKFPDYPNFIHNPIDLSIIKTKARTFKYRTFDSFVSDIKLLKTNCCTYNGPDHSLTKIANTMYDMAVKIYEENRDKILESEVLVGEESFSETTSLTGTQ